MIKKLKKLSKLNSGSEVLEAILMIPVLLAVFFMLAFGVQIYRAKSDIEDVSKVVSRIIMQADDLSEAEKQINDYIKDRKDYIYYNLDKPTSIGENAVYFSINNNIDYICDAKTGETITDKEEIKKIFNDEVKGDIVGFHIRRYCSNWDSVLNSFTIGGNKITITKDRVETYITVKTTGGVNIETN